MSTDRPPAARSLVRHRGFRELTAANALSGIGTGVQALALSYLTFQLTHSAAALGLLAFLALAPGALLSQVGGELAARVGPHRAGAVIYVLRALPWAIVAALGASGHITFPDLAAATGASGVLGALGGVDVPEVVPTTVPVTLRDRAIAVEGSVSQLSLLAGPLVGVSVLAAFGAVPCFAINAASYLPVALALHRVRGDACTESPTRRRTMAMMGMMSMMSSVPMVRLRGTFRRRDLHLLLTNVLVFAAFGEALESLMPVVAHHYSTNPRLLGELMATAAAGGMAATVGLTLLERRDLSKHRVMATCMTGTGICILTIGLVPTLPSTFVAVGCLGGLVAVLLAVSLSWIQLGPQPPPVKTRLVGWYFALVAGSFAIGSLGLGSAVNRFGMAWTLAVCGIFVTSFGAWRLITGSALRGVSPNE